MGIFLLKSWPLKEETRDYKEEDVGGNWGLSLNDCEFNVRKVQLVSSSTEPNGEDCKSDLGKKG